MLQLLLLALFLPSSYSGSICWTSHFVNKAPHGTYWYGGAVLPTEAGQERILKKMDKISYICDEGYSLGYDVWGPVEVTFSCWMYTVYQCRPDCVAMSENISTVTIDVLRGNSSRAITNGTTLSHNEFFNTTCKDSTKTLANSNMTTSIISCSGGLQWGPLSWKYDESQPLDLSCYTPCDGTQLQDDYTTYTSVVGVGQNVSIRACKDVGYTYMMGPETNVTCLDSAREFSSGMPLQYQCYAKPVVNVTVIGEYKVNITAAVDASNAERGLVLEKVVIQRVVKNWNIAEVVFNKTNLPDGDLIMSGYEYYDLALEYGATGYINVAFYYAGFTYTGKPLTVENEFTMGPPALQTNHTIVEYTGTTSVKISLGTDQWSSNIAEIVKDYPDLTFTIELVSEVTREILWITTGNSATNYVKEVSNMMYAVYTMAVPEGTLIDGAMCRVKITSVSQGLTGGSFVLNSEVGAKWTSSCYLSYCETSGARSAGLSVAVVMLCLMKLLFVS